MLESITWYGHATILFETPQGKVIVDPYEMKHEVKADFILITHSHYDHLSPEDIEKCSHKSTKIFAPEDCLHKLEKQVSEISLGDRICMKDNLYCEAVRAYNIDKVYHPKDNNWLGFIIEYNDTRYYIAGDTDRIPEMKDITCHVAFLPVGGTYTMTADEAVQAVSDCQPQMAVPIHWGSIVGSRADAERFVGQIDCGRLLEPH